MVQNNKGIIIFGIILIGIVFTLFQTGVITTPFALVPITTTIDNCDDISGWEYETFTSYAPSLDTVEKVEGSASINMGRFSIELGSGSNYWKTINPINIEGKEIYLNYYIEDDVTLARIESLGIKIGHGVQNGYLKIIPRSELSVGWNLIGGNIDDFILIGTVDKKNVDYIQIITTLTTFLNPIPEGNIKMDNWYMVEMVEENPTFDSISVSYYDGTSWNNYPTDSCVNPEDINNIRLNLDYDKGLQSFVQAGAQINPLTTLHQNPNGVDFLMSICGDGSACTYAITPGIYEVYGELSDVSTGDLYDSITLTDRIEVCGTTGKVDYDTCLDATECSSDYCNEGYCTPNPSTIQVILLTSSNTGNKDVDMIINSISTPNIYLNSKLQSMIDNSLFTTQGNDAVWNSLDIDSSVLPDGSHLITAEVCASDPDGILDSVCKTASGTLSSSGGVLS